uniref:hAT-like transposase RNase-H fold domain-containing protein n=1 Tax=Solanum lycopersicum TaxID=4081 RepID=A0A3Q7IWD2_SOLLC
MSMVCKVVSIVTVMYVQQLPFWMETTPSVTDVEKIINIPSIMLTISQHEGKVTPRQCTPPKKQKRAAPLIVCKSGITGRETSQIWDHFSKFISVNEMNTLWNHLTVKCHKYPFKSDKRQTTLKPIKRGCEGEGLKKLMAKAFPDFEVPSCVTIARHCQIKYQEEKENLKELIKNQRICLTSDTRTSIQNYTYMVITFFQTPDHKGETIAKGIEECLLGWGIENLFKVPLEMLIKKGLDEQIDLISHIRSMDTCGLVYLDAETRWNSTYTMLDKALKFENTFTRMCIFYQATSKFSGSLNFTSHSFFHDFFNLQNDIIKYPKHDDLILVDMTTKMKSKMDKYWGKFESMNMLLIVVVVENDNCVMGESSALLQSQWEKHMKKRGICRKKI